MLQFSLLSNFQKNSMRLQFGDFVAGDTDNFIFIWTLIDLLLSIFWLLQMPTHWLLIVEVLRPNYYVSKLAPNQGIGLSIKFNNSRR